MADIQHQQPYQYRPQQRETDIYSKDYFQNNGPSTSKILAVATLVPVGGTLLFLAGLTLAGTLIGLAIATPLFLLFSPVLVPAAFVIGCSVAGFLTSGAFGITGLSSLSWIANYLRGAGSSTSQQFLDQAKRRAQETAGQLGQKTRDVGQKIQTKSQEGGRATQGQEVGRETESGKNQEPGRK